MPTTLEWIRGANHQWPDLKMLNLDGPQFDQAQGVYIIWHGGNEPDIVCVGQGNIRERLKAESKNESVLEFEKYRLYVAWAPVEGNERTGIERYLSRKLMPKVEKRLPDGEPITVNLPWKKG